MADFAVNPKANFDYEILETIEGGLELFGHEVKAIKTGKASIKGSYVKILNNEAWLVGATVSPYQAKNTPSDYDAQRSRKLLLTKKQINVLMGTSKANGLALVPIKLYNKNNRVKLLIGIGRGKKKYDKREAIKKRDIERARQRGIE